MAGFDDVREKVYQIFASEFAAEHPTVLQRFENQKFEQPNNVPWIYVSVLPGDSIRADIGTNQKNFYHYGAIQVQLMVPESTGTKQLHEMAWTAFRVLADRDWPLPEGKMTTYNCQRRTRGIIGGAYVMNVITEYRHDEALVRP